MAHIVYECENCGEVVPQGSCTCGPDRRLKPVGIHCEFTMNKYVRPQWKKIVKREREALQQISPQQAILAADKYIALLEKALRQHREGSLLNS